MGEQKKKIGLALGGGAARGIAHIGALKVFDDFRIKFDYIAGTSIGSIIGAAYAAGVSWVEMLRYARYFKTRDVLKWKRWSIGYDPHTIGQIMIKIIGDCNIEELKIPYCAVAVDVLKGKEVIIKTGKVADAVTASSCVPGIFSPIKGENQILVDGGVLNNVPTNIVKAMGSDIVIGVDLNSNSIPQINSGSYFEVLYATFNLMMTNNATIGRQFTDVLISPDMRNIPFHVINDVDQLVKLGEEAAKKAVPQIKSLLREY